MKIADLIRTSYVKRWHIVDLSKEQSVAEHSALVAFIAVDLIRKTDGIDSAHMLGAVWWALYHDVNEVILGDPPGNLKLTPGFKDVYDKLASHYCPGVSSMDVPIEVVQAVKISDLIESIRYIRRYGVGIESTFIEEDIYSRLKDYADNSMYVETWYDTYQEVMYDSPTIVNVEIPSAQLDTKNDHT